MIHVVLFAEGVVQMLDLGLAPGAGDPDSVPVIWIFLIFNFFQGLGMWFECGIICLQMSISILKIENVYFYVIFLFFNLYL